MQQREYQIKWGRFLFNGFVQYFVIDMILLKNDLYSLNLIHNNSANKFLIINECI